MANLPTGIDPQPYRIAADRVLAGQFDVFALRNVQLGFPPDWNVDPKTGTRAPAVFGKAIDYRNEQCVGDVKYLWEVNRHLELVTLAQAWHLTHDVRYAEGCRTLLTSWFDASPYPMGVNWTSSLESGYRLVNWSVAWHLLGGGASAIFEGEVGRSFRDRWLAAVREHCHFIAGYFSRFSSANNHLLGEYTGLFVGSLTWPLWPESRRWLDDARSGLDTEFVLQTGPDGVNREQAIHYQRSVMDMMLIAVLVGRRNGHPLSEAVVQRLEAMVGFLSAIADRDGRVPSIGDSDDALLVRWDPTPGFHATRSLLATGAMLFDRPDWLARAGRVDVKTRWLLGDPAERLAARPTVASRDESAGRKAFPEGGYYVLDRDRGGPQEVIAVFDCGPLGYPSIAAHGHADALSLMLTAGGVQWLIDPGTYAYHTERRWRDYFRSTAGHNTVCIDGQDQSVSGGAFLWLNKASARCLGFERNRGRRRVVGEHDGYRRLSDPVVHRRSVEFLVDSDRFIVEDEIVCRGRHNARVCWHFGEACTVQATPSGVVARSGGMALTMDGPPGSARPRLLAGEEGSETAGWYSPSYDRKAPITTVVWDVEVSGATRFVTTIQIDFRHHD